MPRHQRILTSTEAPLLRHDAKPLQNVKLVSYKFSQEQQPEKLSNWHKLRRSATALNGDLRASSGRDGVERPDLWKKDVVIDLHQTITVRWCFAFINKLRREKWEEISLTSRRTADPQPVAASTASTDALQTSSCYSSTSSMRNNDRETFRNEK